MNAQEYINEEKARELSEKLYCGCKDYIGKKDLFSYLMSMAQWKDEQLESKLMQIIILAQQGYTSGATDEMILRQCKEIINENYEQYTATTD